MSVLKKFFNNTRKPEGAMGRMMAKSMNSGHAKLAAWGFGHLKLKGNETAYDLGCGGGANVRYLVDKLPEGYVIGLDYSPVSVEVASQTNAKAIHAGRCEIVQGDVQKLPMADASADLVTAFETVYFWQRPEHCFEEIYRVLKSGGIFMITNESDGKNAGSLKWTKIVDGMTIYTAEQLEAMLRQAGFASIEIDDQVDKDRICVVARKT